MSERYARQTMMPDFGDEVQQALAAANVAVLGVGGLGSACATGLAGSGVGRLTLVDDDRVALSNLQRQTLYRTEDVGRGKASTAAEALRAINPDIVIDAEGARLTPANADGLVRGRTLVVDALDNLADRCLLADACEARRVPLVTASVEGYEGRLTVFLPPAKGETGLRFRDAYPDGATDFDRGCEALGVLGPAAQAMGALAAAEAIKTLAHLVGAPIGELLTGRLFVLDIRHWRSRVLRYGSA